MASRGSATDGHCRGLGGGFLCDPASLQTLVVADAATIAGTGARWASASPSQASSAAATHLPPVVEPAAAKWGVLCVALEVAIQVRTPVLSRLCARMEDVELSLPSRWAQLLGIDSLVCVRARDPK